MEWKPIETAPNDGSQFIVFNGEEMLILNQPQGCALGRWIKNKYRWYGSFVRLDNPTHWMELPEPPNKG